MNTYRCVTSASETAPVHARCATLVKNACELRFVTALAPDQLAFSERPFVIDNALATIQQFGLDVHAQRHNGRRAWAMVEQCASRMPEEDLRDLMLDGYATGAHAWKSPGDDTALAYIRETHPIKDEALLRHLWDIFMTNAVVSELNLLNGELFPVQYGFYLLLSRANHACVPSACLGGPIGPTGNTGTRVYAARAVEAGEALTLDYAAGIPLEKKRAYVFKEFGFRCACSRCSSLCMLLTCNSDGSKQCPCGRARYCSVQHQRADWARHKVSEHVLSADCVIKPK